MATITLEVVYSAKVDVGELSNSAIECLVRAAEEEGEWSIFEANDKVALKSVAVLSK